MNYEQFNIAFMNALRHGDHARCNALLDEFVHTAQGVDLGYALSSKAGYLMLHDQGRSVEALSLVDDALALAEGSPALQMKCVTRGLGLCYNIGDTERAKRYEQLGHQLLRENPDDADVRFMHPTMCFNLAQLAWLRQEPAQAYWHLVQATQSVVSSQAGNPEQRRKTLFNLYTRTADICLEMNRTPEAEDALNKAKPHIASSNEEFAWRLMRSRYLLTINQVVAAKQLLDAESGSDLANVSPHSRVLYHLNASLVAQALGDVRGFHFHLARAQDQALDHRQDHMLARIQRVMRTPVRLEAAK